MEFTCINATADCLFTFQASAWHCTCFSPARAKYTVKYYLWQTCRLQPCSTHWEALYYACLFIPNNTTFCMNRISYDMQLNIFKQLVWWMDLQWVKGWRNESINKCRKNETGEPTMEGTKEWTNAWMNEGRKQGGNEQRNEWLTDWMNKLVKKQRDKRASKEISKRVSSGIMNELINQHSVHIW